MTKQTNLQRAKADWLKLFKEHGAEKFLDSFLRNVEGAESVCVHCGQKIYVDVLIGGGVPDWSTRDGDFGCDASPDTGKGGTGGHFPRRATWRAKSLSWELGSTK
jgi:hypothetical protein